MPSRFASGGRPSLLSLAVWALGLTFISAAGTPVTAQTGLPADQQANLVMEVNLDRFRASPIGEAMKAGDLLGESIQLGELGELDWNRIRTLRVSVRLPQDVNSVMNSAMTGGDLPLQFSIEISASDPTALEQFRAMIQGESKLDTVEGQQLFRPIGGPGNIAAIIPDDLTLAIGTDDYLVRIGQNLAGDGVLDLWKGMPNGVLRIAGDLQQCEQLFDELQQMGGMAPPEMGALLEALPQIASLSVRQDFEGENLLVIRAASRKPDSIGAIRGLMDSLAGMIRENADNGIEPPPEMKPVADMMREIAEGTKVSDDSNSVSMTIALPENFATRLREGILPLMNSARSQTESMNDMKQVCLAMHNYYDVHRRFPQSPDPNSAGKISWRVHVLPFLEEQALFDRVDFSQDSDSAGNSFLADKMPPTYGDDGRNTRIVAVKTDRQPKSFADIADGTSKTICFVRMSEAVPWSMDRDVTIDQVMKMFATMAGQEQVMVGFYDGSVRMLPANIEPEKLRALLTPAGGEIVDF